ncbi:MAG TPA: hypothetical protein DCX21_04765 [Eubacterium sp.]|nr:hypothetical protein [Eubacterium sp.]HBZ52553.1 hypothetical protein [Eubacterium sp.]
MRRNKKLIITDLTPLLDVIFILLFIILMRNRGFQENVVAKVTDELDRTKVELNTANEKIADYETIFSSADFITVYVEKGLSGYDRTLVVREGDHYTNYQYDWQKYPNLKSELNEILEGYCKKKEKGKPFFIIFAYDSEQIFRKDFETIKDTLISIQSQYDDVYAQIREKKLDVEE